MGQAFTTPRHHAANEPMTCPACAAAALRWATGGGHFMCRACEVAGVDAKAPAARSAFYTARLRAITTQHLGGPNP